MDVRDRVLYCEAEIQVLRDTVWRLTSRVLSLEHNVSKYQHGESTSWNHQKEQLTNSTNSTETGSIHTGDAQDGDPDEAYVDSAVQHRVTIKSEPLELVDQDHDGEAYEVHEEDHTSLSIRSSPRRVRTLYQQNNINSKSASAGVISSTTSSFTPLSYSTSSSYYHSKQPSTTCTQSTSNNFHKHFNLLHNHAKRCGSCPNGCVSCSSIIAPVHVSPNMSMPPPLKLNLISPTISPAISTPPQHLLTRQQHSPTAPVFGATSNLLITRAGENSAGRVQSSIQQLISRSRSSSNNSALVHLQQPKRHICLHCNKKFKRAQELTVHTRIHTGEKPYACPVCFKAFSQSSSVKLHLPVHTGWKPYNCSICSKAFARLSHMKKHVKTIHPQQED